MGLQTTMKTQKNNNNFRFCIDPNIVQFIKPESGKVYMIEIIGVLTDKGIKKFGEE